MRCLPAFGRFDQRVSVSAICQYVHGIGQASFRFIAKKYRTCAHTILIKHTLKLCSERYQCFSLTSDDWHNPWPGAVHDTALYKRYRDTVILNVSVNNLPEFNQKRKLKRGFVLKTWKTFFKHPRHLPVEKCKSVLNEEGYQNPPPGMDAPVFRFYSESKPNTNTQVSAMESNFQCNSIFCFYQDAYRNPD